MSSKGKSAWRLASHPVGKPMLHGIVSMTSVYGFMDEGEKIIFLDFYMIKKSLKSSFPNDASCSTSRSQEMPEYLLRIL